MSYFEIFTKNVNAILRTFSGHPYEAVNVI